MFGRLQRCSQLQQHKWSCYSTGQEQQQQQPDLSLLHPLLQLQWHPVRNAHLQGKLVTPKSHTKVWWTCDQCPDGRPHEWEALVSSRSAGSSCPYCASRAVCPHNSLATKAPEIAAQWSDRNRGDPHQYMASSGPKVWWKCSDGHEWIARIGHRTRRHSQCPHCDDQSQKGKPQQRHPTLAQTDHPMMQLWDWDTNAAAGFDPSKITCRSNKRTHWICHNCSYGQPHRWQAAVKSLYSGTGCPCCAGRKVCTCNSLKSLHPDLAKEWDYSKNEDLPEEYPAGARATVWWRNSKRGSFRARIDSRTHPRKPLPAVKPVLGRLPALTPNACLPPSHCMPICPALTLRSVHIDSAPIHLLSVCYRLLEQLDCRAVAISTTL